MVINLSTMVNEMTNENELIRRGDAIGLFEGPDTCPIQFDYGEARERIAAIPAVADTPEVLALVEAARMAADDLDGYVGQSYGDYMRAAIAAWEASRA